MLTLKLIREAASFLQGRIIETPLELSPRLSDLVGGPVYLKLEHLQKTGSFKFRGALFRMSRLSPHEKKKGVITCSAGNHGWATAEAARQLSIKATVYVPASVDPLKLAAIHRLHAEGHVSRHTGYDQTEREARDAAKESGQVFLSPFDDYAVMAANGGTLAMEILGQLPKVATVVMPVGGGGLAAGLCFYLKAVGQSTRCLGCQHEGSPALHLSLERGEAVTELPPIETVAGGIEGGIGSLTFAVLRDLINGVLLVSEHDILEAVRWLLEHPRMLVEPSAAASVAACLKNASRLEPPVVLVLTGRNVSLETVRKSLCQT
jgi:threonine dehydratase